ncbi:cyclin-D4-2-like [Punica granatum]|uniref:Cyclin-D4-2-like n=1 Tax=Punica granatum TaxID=22663 RepID=A0A218WH15_PUNGR|nr:cyclin-D4-2-like [Punica granatum]OWM71312.1 hypothetical protein CDL15_Pgr011440 [Punica granatum]
MAPVSLDCLLLCGEDNSSVFDEPDCRDGTPWQQQQQPGSSRGGSSSRRRDRPGDEPEFPVQSEECLGALVEKEGLHLPKCDYLKRLKNGDLDLGARAEAIDWMFKVHSHYNFGPLCTYLSVNYLDRFLSAYELPKGKAWMTQLLAVACLSLAAKMEEHEVPFSLDLQVAESRYVFEAKTIQRMELLVLSTLSWRMHAVSPFSFIDNFLSRISGNNTPPKALISRSVQVILSTLRGIELLEFRPSEVAAAVAICVVAEGRLARTEEAISALAQHVDKLRVRKCMDTLRELGVMGESANNVPSSVSSVPQSPIGVLEAACFSYNSSHNNTPDDSNKRRKIDASSSCQV